MLSVFCASDCPAASVSTQAKSLDSFTSVENDVRRSAFAASSTAEMVRRQRISRVTASKGWLVAVRGAWDMSGYQAELSGLVNVRIALRTSARGALAPGSACRLVELT